MHSSSSLEVTLQQKFTSALAFGLTSFVIVFTNKFVLGDCLRCYGFPSVKFLAFVQCIASCFVMFLQKHILGTMMGNEKYKNLYPSLSWNVVKQIMPLPVLFFLNMLSGLSATKSLNIPMFVLLRRFSIAMTLILEFYLLKKTSTNVIITAVSLMLVGALVAAVDDITVDAISIFYILTNDLFTALQGVTLKMKMNKADDVTKANNTRSEQTGEQTAKEDKPLSSDGVMFYNSFLSSIPALIWWLSNPKEVDAVLTFKAWSKSGFIFWFCSSMFLGFVLNYTYFLCTKYNSALTSTVVGSAKNCVSSYVGMFLGDYKYSPLNFLGVNISLFAAVLYSYGEVQKQQQAKAISNNNSSNTNKKDDSSSSGGGGGGSNNNNVINSDQQKKGHAAV